MSLAGLESRLEGLSIKGGAYLRGALIRGFTVVANFTFCFGILMFFVSNLILTLFRNIAKSWYHRLEF